MRGTVVLSAASAEMEFICFHGVFYEIDQEISLWGRQLKKNYEIINNFEIFNQY
jgi:hypothetical protein